MNSREVLGRESVLLKEPVGALENFIKWQNCVKDTGSKRRCTQLKDMEGQS